MWSKDPSRSFHNFPLAALLLLSTPCWADQHEERGLRSFACPFLSRHVEVYDELQDGSGFKARFGEKFLSELPAACVEGQHEKRHNDHGSFLQVGLGLKVSRMAQKHNSANAALFRPSLVPYPKSVSLIDKSSAAFVLSKATTISLGSLGSGLSEDAPFVVAAMGDLRQRIIEATSSLPDGGKPGSLISLSMVTKEGAHPESYKLTVDSGQINLEGYGAAGFSHGVTTLQQLIPFSLAEASSSSFNVNSLAEIASGENVNAGVLPAMVIEDSPAFQWRGLHLDVSRHFFPASDVKKLLNTMAAYKLNRFHWHLTDDQGWRFPVPEYPKLTQIGAGPRFKGKRQMSAGAGIEGSYTEEDIRDVLNYAKARHIQVIPEVDVPGHTAAAIAAYPELGNPDFPPPSGPQHEYGVHQWTLAPTNRSAAFLEAVFAQVANLFPDSEYIHLGGDEAPADQWRSSSKKARESWEPFEGDNAQSYFNHKVSDIIRSHGKKMAGWDEVQAMKGLPPDAAIFAWRGENELRKALDNNFTAINAENGHLYLDHYQGPEGSEPKAIGGPLTTTRHVYEYRPVPSWVPEDKKHLVLGGQAQLWSEYFPDWNQVEYMAWPRAVALAERLWSPEEELSYPDFSRRLNNRVGDLQHWGVNFHPLQE